MGAGITRRMSVSVGNAESRPDRAMNCAKGATPRTIANHALSQLLLWPDTIRKARTSTSGDIGGVASRVGLLCLVRVSRRRTWSRTARSFSTKTIRRTSSASSLHNHHEPRLVSLLAGRHCFICRRRSFVQTSGSKESQYFCGLVLVGVRSPTICAHILLSIISSYGLDDVVDQCRVGIFLCDCPLSLSEGIPVCRYQSGNSNHLNAGICRGRACRCAWIP